MKIVENVNYYTYYKEQSIVPQETQNNHTCSAVKLLCQRNTCTLRFSYSHNIQDIKIRYILFLNEKGNCMYITECCFSIKEWNPIICANKPLW